MLGALDCRELSILSAKFFRRISASRGCVGGFAAVSACCFPEILDAVSPKSGNVGAVSPKLLPWTLYRELIRIEDGVARRWYEQEALRETWSSRTLHRNIGSQYYYRLMQSPKKDKVAEEMHQITAPMQDKLEFIKNPVVAEFLGLAQNPISLSLTLKET